MRREEFLHGLEASLSGNVPPSVVRENLRYYDDYTRTELEKGRAEAEVMEELGEPRLIARTIMDATPGAEEGAYEEYHPYGSYARSASGRSGDADEGAGDSGRFRETIRYYDLSKWYWKLLAVVVVIAVFTIVITVVSGLLSLVIPILPVIGLIIVIMWFVRGPRQ